MGRSQRTKGHSFERAIAIAMRAVFPGARRGLGQARAANEVPDVDGTGWWVECKAHRHVQIRAAFRQATEAAQGRAPVLVVSKDDREPVLATMLLDDLINLLGREKYGELWGAEEDDFHDYDPARAAAAVRRLVARPSEVREAPVNPLPGQDLGSSFKDKKEELDLDELDCPVDESGQ